MNSFMGTVYAAAKAPKEEREADGTKRTATETGCSAFTASSPSVSQSERFSIPSARLVCVYTSVTREAQRIHSPLCIKHTEGETKRERKRGRDIPGSSSGGADGDSALLCSDR